MKIYLFIICLASTLTREALAQKNGKDLPNFNRSLLLEERSDTTANISLGDLDGDGHLDILLVKGRHWPIITLPRQYPPPILIMMGLSILLCRIVMVAKATYTIGFQFHDSYFVIRNTHVMILLSLISLLLFCGEKGKVIFLLLFL
ncbi:MAG TPA: VCBS repeat-containing protein [Puia sp.]|jgi:hypothetical protein